MNLSADGDLIMKLECEKCSQKYYIPEDKISDKMSFFICEKCGHRILVDPMEGLNSKGTLCMDHKYYNDSIADYICHSFSRKGILTAFSFIYVISLITALTGYMVAKNPGFFSSHAVFSAISAFILILILKYAWDFLLYLLSLNAFYRFNHDKDIHYTTFSQRIFSDSPVILFFSSAGIALLVFLSIPVYLLKESGPFYATIFLPFLLAAAAILVWPWMTKGFLYALIAGKTRSFKNTFRVIGDFIYTENINIAAYAVVIRVVTFFISVLLLAVLSAPLIAAAIITGIFANAGTASTAYHYEDAGYFLLFFLSLLTAFASAYLTVLKQTLRSAAVKIMEVCPGESISGKTKIIAMFALAAFLIILGGFILLIFTSTGFTAIISAAALGTVLKSLF